MTERDYDKEFRLFDAYFSSLNLSSNSKES